jgi:hypothetical protein
MHLMHKQAWICTAAALAVGAAIAGATAPLQACEGHNHHSKDGSAISKKVAMSFVGRMHRASLQSPPAMSFVRAKNDPHKK